MLRHKYNLPSEENYHAILKNIIKSKRADNNNCLNVSEGMKKQTHRCHKLKKIP